MTRYALKDVDLAEPIEDLPLEPDQSGAGVTWRFQGALLDFCLTEAERPGATIPADALRTYAAREPVRRLLARKACDMLEARWNLRPPERRPPSVTVAICTKDRPERLVRLLDSLTPFVRGPAPFASVEVLVIDNAPSDDRTERLVAERDGFRHVVEPRTGLDFARNAAVAHASGELLAFMDDDVVADPRWLQGLWRAWSADPEAGAWTGTVLPYELESRAQIEFEARGGFNHGFYALTYDQGLFGHVFHPVSAGMMGVGCNMVFERALIGRLGGFDEALDTGAPLPGGGDLDGLYRVVRAGRRVRYEPQMTVRHQHRQTLDQLARQYWTWGLGFMAFVAKQRKADPDTRDRQRGMIRWWFGDKLQTTLAALRRGDWRSARFLWAELRGGAQGLFGEYDRSRARVAAIRAAVESRP